MQVKPPGYSDREADVYYTEGNSGRYLAVYVTKDPSRCPNVAVYRTSQDKSLSSPIEDELEEKDER